MTIYTRPDDLIFASEAKPGETTTFPDIPRGWGVTEKTNFIPPMEYFNAAFQRIDKAIAYLMQRGVAEWSATIEYPAQAVTIKAGQIFFALQQNTNKDPFTNSDVWVNSFAQKANLADFERLNDSLIGSVQMFAYKGDQAPEDFLWCDEGLYNPEDYPKLFAKMGYTWGRSGDKFATPPNTEANRFPRCAGGGLRVGMVQNDAIRNITGSASSGGYAIWNGFARFNQYQGAFSNSNIGEGKWEPNSPHRPIESGSGYRGFYFDASKSVPTDYENRPYSIVYMFAIKYK